MTLMIFLLGYYSLTLSDTVCFDSWHTTQFGVQFLARLDAWLLFGLLSNFSLSWMTVLMLLGWTSWCYSVRRLDETDSRSNCCIYLMLHRWWYLFRFDDICMNVIGFGWELTLDIGFLAAVAAAYPYRCANDGGVTQLRQAVSFWWCMYECYWLW